MWDPAGDLKGPLYVRGAVSRAELQDFPAVSDGLICHRTAIPVSRDATETERSEREEIR